MNEYRISYCTWYEVHDKTCFIPERTAVYGTLINNVTAQQPCCGIPFGMQSITICYVLTNT